MLASRSPPGQGRSAVRRVTRLQVSCESLRIDHYWRHLDDAERQRASRFRNEVDRTRFIVARSSLRQLLGQCTGIAARDIAFGENRFGKPHLRDTSIELHFSTSHSGDWVLHAIDEVAPIGIDVEVLRCDMARIDSFRGVLAPEEFALLRHVPEAHRARAFATVWVRKEAYVKALGEGMSRPLQGVCITVDTAGCPRLLYDRSAGESSARWQFEDIEVDTCHVACVVSSSDG